MKNKLIILMIGCSVSVLAACSGDRVPENTKDTVNNRYGVAKDTAKMDTSKVKSSDNSASGGVSLMKKDSAKKDSSKK